MKNVGSGSKTTILSYSQVNLDVYFSKKNVFKAIWNIFEHFLAKFHIMKDFLRRFFWETQNNHIFFWECKKWDKVPPHKITNPASSKSSLGCLFRWQAPIRCQTALFCYKTHLLAGISRIFTQEHGGGNHNYKSHSKLIEDKPR